MKKVAILYICTGRYKIFWKDFFDSCEQFFLNEFRKEYFVFSDSDDLNDQGCVRIHLIPENQKEWPFATLYRFKMFASIKEQLKNFDYIFFFNANMRFLEVIGSEILPSKEEGLLVVKHPGYYNKSREEFTYEKNPESLAFIPEDRGEAYFMGGFNGGRADDYLKMILSLDVNIDKDYEKGIIAVWHDESHLNRYILDYNPKVLGAAYGCPEGQCVDELAKIIILDKRKFGGHEFLRSQSEVKNYSQLFVNKLRSFFK
ncbi:MAG: hypothetical protein KBH01_00225 [Breznakibacter sp.]|nr:hypothetical protein [Breznakibacter sp.]